MNGQMIRTPEESAQIASFNTVSQPVSTRRKLIQRPPHSLVLAIAGRGRHGAFRSVFATFHVDLSMVQRTRGIGVAISNEEKEFPQWRGLGRWHWVEQRRPRET